MIQWLGVAALRDSDNADVILLFKALALGASAVEVGPPIHYGLAVGDAPGVTSVLNALNIELKLAMKLAGCATVSDITEKIRASGLGRAQICEGGKKLFASPPLS